MNLQRVHSTRTPRPGVFTKASGHAEATVRRVVAALLLVFGPSWAWAGESPLFAAIVSLDRVAFDDVLESGADVNEIDTYGQTPLMYAVSRRQVGLSAALLEAGADVSAMTQAGWTALHYAAQDMAPVPLVTLLLEAWADPHARDESGETAEQLAVRTGNQAFLNALRAFEDATRSRLVEAISTLDGMAFSAALEYGADVNQVDEYGQTPLMYAVTVNQSGMVRRLLGAGAHVSARSEAGWTALHYSARAGVADAIATTLMDAGASRTIRNNDGDTAYDVAQQHGNTMFLTAHERFDTAERAAEADRQANADRAASTATGAGNHLSSPRNSNPAADSCAPPATSGRTRAVVIEGTAQGADAFWRSTLSSVFGSSVSHEGGTIYSGVDTFRRAVFIASVPYSHACSGGRAVVDLGEVRACSVRFDVRSISGYRPNSIQLHLNSQATSTVRVELPWSAGPGLERLALCDVTTLRW